MTETDDTEIENKGERIARRLSRAGICSRREAERWIEAGRVAVDGKTIHTPATLVTDENHIAVDGKPIRKAEHTRLWRYHKPAGLICTTNDPEGRPTVFERLPKELPRVILVGRLDLTSEGLLLLTNDGALARKLELPAAGWVRRYRVRVYGHPNEDVLAGLNEGVTVEGVHYGPIRAKLESIRGDNAWITVSLQEGKNREIRRVMEHLNLRVTRLFRTSFGPYDLGSLTRGAVEEVPARVIADQAASSPNDPKGGRSRSTKGWAKKKEKPGGKKPPRGRSSTDRKQGADRRR
jgi:23S rRNA pseudouridine2605 synthase